MAGSKGGRLVTDGQLRHGPRRPWFGPHRPLLRRLAQPVIDILRVETGGGVALFVATMVALIWANSPWQSTYAEFWTTTLQVRVGGFEVAEDLRHWVNDGLMVLFFFVVGLEIKTEMVRGELQDARRAALPAAAAAGGMLVPAGIYLAVNSAGGVPDGWGVPVATDIAFAVGVLALLGRRVPQGLRIFVLALAIVDDIGAILVIALFYTDNLSVGWLAAAVGLTGLVVLMRWIRIWYIPAYTVVGVAVWLATLESGVHATVAGVALGLLAPASPLITPEQAEAVAEDLSGDDGHRAPGQSRDLVFLTRESHPIAERLQDDLHPWTSYVIVPLFALANAGLMLSGDMLGDAAGSPVAHGIVAGLVVGKPLGVVCAAWLATRFLGASLTSGARWGHIAGAGALAGIGFTMSLFIAGLAFPESGPAYDHAKLAIFAGSLVAAAVGALVLMRLEPSRVEE